MAVNVDRVNLPVFGGASRCLFGRPDREETAKFLARELSAIMESKTREWNFDFENTIPLSGRFQWFPVTDDDREEEPPRPLRKTLSDEALPTDRDDGESPKISHFAPLSRASSHCRSCRTDSVSAGNRQLLITGKSESSARILARPCWEKPIV